MYLYASHLGGYFGTGKKLENRVCGICGDEDVYIGAARDARAAKKTAVKVCKRDVRGELERGAGGGGADLSPGQGRKGKGPGRKV